MILEMCMAPSGQEAGAWMESTCYAQLRENEYQQYPHEPFQYFDMK